MTELKSVQLIVYDFDGVMTDNTVIVDQKGSESVVVNRSDGLAIGLIKKMGIPQMILSTEVNNVVLRRAEKLNIFCLNGIDNKKEALDKYLKDNNIDKEHVIFIGNDLNDVEVMRYVGIPIAPNDAYHEAKSIAKIVTKTNGGKGVIRELLDIIYKSYK